MILSGPHKELLRRYLVVINKKLKERGLRPVGMAQLAGAMLSFLLGHHEETILDEHARDAVAALRAEHGRLLDEYDLGGTGEPPPDADVRRAR